MDYSRSTWTSTLTLYTAQCRAWGGWALTGSPISSCSAKASANAARIAYEGHQSFWILLVVTCCNIPVSHLTMVGRAYIFACKFTKLSQHVPLKLGPNGLDIFFRRDKISTNDHFIDRFNMIQLWVCHHSRYRRLVFPSMVEQGCRYRRAQIPVCSSKTPV